MMSTHANSNTVEREAPPSVEYVDETPRRARRTDREITAEGTLGHHWVTLLSIERPIPRKFGDNQGMLPIWVEAHADWRTSGRAYDQQQPSAATRAVRLAVLGCKSDEHAKRLKLALDEALLGRANENESDELRFRFRNAVDFGALDEWWQPLLSDVLQRCEAAAIEFSVFTRADHERMLAELIERTADSEQKGRR